MAINLRVVSRFAHGIVMPYESASNQKKNHDRGHNPLGPRIGAKNPTARVSVSARRSLPERRSPDCAGSGSFVSTRTGSFTSSSSSYCGDILIGSATLFSSQKCSRPLLRLTQGAHQRKLGYIVLIQRLDMVFIGACNRFLRLHYFKASGNAGLVAVLRFLQLLGRKLNLLLGHPD